MPELDEEVKTGEADVEEDKGDLLEAYVDPAGVPSPDAWRQAVADFYQLDLDASVLWKQVGPAPLVVDADQNHMGIGPDAGEVTDVFIDPGVANDQSIYLTTNDGGVWHTSNGGTLWLPLTDPMFSNSMGAIAMDPANSSILYAGSGNLFDGGGTFTRSAGIYRSTDSGLSWDIVDGGYFGTLFSKVGILKIVCPMANTLLVATNNGLYRSVDGGRNFGANGPDFNDRNPILQGKICCLLLDAATPASTVYCGVAGDSGVATMGLLKSTNGGITFPTNLFADPTAPQLPYGSFVVAQSQFDGTTANSAVLYVAVQGRLATGANTFLGLWRSANSGSTWSPRPNLTNVAAVNGFNQSAYDLTLGVDPLNSNRVYAGFQQLWLSIDGGQNFLNTSVTAGKVHWDNHVMVFSPAPNRPAVPASGPVPPTAIYTGTDGGIAKSTDGGSNWTCINGKMATNLFQGIGIGSGINNTGKGIPNSYTYGGMQDTGTAGHRPADSLTDWHAGINGDGWLVAVDPSDPTIVYGFDNQFFIKTSDAGAHWDISNVAGAARKVGIGLTNGGSPRAIAVDQTGNNPATRIVWVSEIKTLNKSTDGGKNFTATAFAAPDDIRSLATTTGSANIIWAGCADGSIHCSTDGGTSWDTGAFTSKPAGAVKIGRISGIAIDPTNLQRVVCVCDRFSNVHAKYRTRHVFLTLDGGATWADISGTDGNGPVGNVPDMPLCSVVFDITGSTASQPPAIIIAGDAGVLRSTDAKITDGVGTATWKIYGAGLPMVCCKSLAIDNSVSPAVLRVGTYGRSCFEATRPTGPKYAAEGNLACGVIATGQSATVSYYVYNSGDTALQITAAHATVPFSVGADPAIPVTIQPGATQKFQITFTDNVAHEPHGLLQFDTNDPSGTQFISLSGTVIDSKLKQRLAVNPTSSCGFGIVEVGSNRTIPVQVFNVGTAPLNVTGITRTSGSADFSINPALPTPIPPIAAGAELDFTIQFAPSGAGDLNAEFTIASDDPHGAVKITTSGTGSLATAGAFAQFLRSLGIVP
ncbi:choice-of-anchor D domain-containing protein [Occallatibacter riparius]|uniref:Choice-of-anchor D domain-containing protein n=1 Tax=Occallatibacter riparius TaxID=1002689 RepID=A0A9J7BP51_9BACT|nr:choice-of-anchor D domain-containing protein [Occallatibacter riparius]UWZ84399.1 choice-of-anchor D domain-containing protein [Occallatibacter riparius]